MPNKRKNHTNIIIYIALGMLCLVLVTASMSSGLLAKYTTGSKSIIGARTAKFSVSAERSDNNGDIEFVQADGEFKYTDNSYEVTITNTSETAVRYKIVLKFPEGVTKYLKVNNMSAAEGSDTIEFNGVDLLPGNSTKKEKFEFTVTDAFYEQNAGSENGLSMDDVEIEFEARVKVEQVD
ncbi:MAG: hypothetical protein J5879_06595 [Clostridia bacterium]|nr:hypothetical protein [Clostridia bacterium]